MALLVYVILPGASGKTTTTTTTTKASTTGKNEKKKKETDVTNCSKTISQLTRTYSNRNLVRSSLEISA